MLLTPTPSPAAPLRFRPRKACSDCGLNSFRITLFADHYLLTLMESNSYEKQGRGALPCCCASVGRTSPLKSSDATLASLFENADSKEPTKHLSPLNATLTRKAGGATRLRTRSLRAQLNRTEHISAPATPAISSDCAQFPSHKGVGGGLC